MLKFSFPLIFLLIIGFSCNSPRNSPDENQSQTVLVDGKQIHVIPFNSAGNNPEEIGLLELFNDFEIIQLETSKECMIKNWTTCFTDKSILVSTQTGGIGPVKVLEFDLNGNYIKEIGGRGKGPGEHTGYLMTSGVYYDTDELLLKFASGSPEMHLFNSNGEFLKNLKSPLLFTVQILKTGDDIYLSLGSLTSIPQFDKDSIMAVFYNGDGTFIKSLPRFKYPPKNTSQFVMESWGPSFIRHQNNWKFYQPGSDTVYSVQGQTIEVDFVLEFGDNARKYNVGTSRESQIDTYEVQIKGETDKHIYFDKVLITGSELEEVVPGLKIDQFKYQYSCILYDKSSGQTRNLTFKDDLLGLFPKEEIIDRINFDSYGPIHMIAHAYEILEWIEDERLESLSEETKNRIIELCDNIDENSNPIVFVLNEK